jgi:hypothetical protein
MTKQGLSAALILIFTISYLNSTAQQLLEQPACLKKPVKEYNSGVMLTTQAAGTLKGSTWMVFAAKNNISGEPTSGSGIKTFNFMDAFVVVEERVDKVKAVEAAFVKITTLLPGANDHMYWFKKSDMLLWLDCLSEKNVVVGEYKAEFNKKAMVINRLDIANINPASTGFFSSPVSDLSNKIADARDFTILFVYKEENDFYLLGPKPRLSRTTYREDIKGWVSTQYLTTWNHHLSLEMNWDSCERQPVRIYSQLGPAKSYYTNATYSPTQAQGAIIFRESPMYCARQTGSLNRFYLLTQGIDMTEQYPKVGVVGKMEIKGITQSNCLPATVDPLKVAQIRDKLTKGFNYIKRVNILFVVDATASMEAYRTSIIRALTQTMGDILEKNKAEEKGLDYYFGAVVFRDQAEVIPIEYSNLGNWTDDVSVMVNFFGQAMDPAKNGRDRDHPEALYYGIQQAINTFDVNSLNTNYLVLIGDACNNTASFPEATEAKVIDLLNKKNYNLLTYQIHYRQHESNAYADFRTQVDRITQQIAVRKNERLWNDYNTFVASCPAARDVFYEFFKNFPTSFNPSTDMTCSTDNNGNKICSINSESFPIITQTYYPRDSVTVLRLQQELGVSLNDIALKTEETIKKLGKALGGESTENEYRARVIYFCLNLRLSLDEILTLLLATNELYQDGYTCLKPSWADHPLFNYVALIGHVNVQQIQDYINDLVPPGKIQNEQVLREHIYDIWKKILTRELNLIRPEEFDDLSIGQDITYLTGLPAPEQFKKVYNRDILYSTQFSADQLYAHCVDLIISNGHLQSLMNGKDMLNQQYFKSYSAYIRRFLEFKNTPQEPSSITPEKQDAFYSVLANKYARAADYGFNEENFPKYPYLNIEPTKPDYRYFWYYWLDARDFPNLITNPSNDVLQTARTFLRNRTN